MKIERNVPLAPMTTLGVGGRAEYYTTAASEAGLREAFRYAREHGVPATVLAGGSNVLIADEGVRGLVIKNELGGVRFEEDDGAVIVHAGAGENFDALVAACVSRGLWGLENLSAIPGSVGATPVQNVGAYGVEVRDVLHAVRVYDTESDTTATLSPDECRFAYRDSIFKHGDGARYVVTEVAYRLSVKPDPRLTYKDLAETFGPQTPTLGEVREAVTLIRAKKFPDWRRVGTAGSFFKNPILVNDAFSALKAKYPALPGFPAGTAHTKIPLGWVIEHVLKKRGFRNGNVGTFSGQALVVVNYGGASAREVDAFAACIAEEIFQATGIVPEREVTRIA